MKGFFQKAATHISAITGTWGVFLTAFSIVVGWGVLGPFMHFSDTWQLVISTISSIVTFLMVFLIQYAQNKDTKAIHLKLDELIRIHRKARDTFVNIEVKPDEELNEKMSEFNKLGEEDKKNVSQK